MERYKPIKLLVCVVLSMHLSSQILFYLLTTDEKSGDAEVRKYVQVDDFQALKSFQNNNNKTNITAFLDLGIVNIEKLIFNRMEKANTVPKIIHQSWSDYNIPYMTVKWVRRWKETNPDWDYVFWTDKSSRQFMSTYFPDYLALYDGFSLPVQKADLFRYFVLYAIGGVYADLDVEPLRSLNEVTKNASCILSQEPEAHHRILHPEFSTADNNYTLSCNAFMMCRNRHPYMAFLIQKIVERRLANKECTLPQTLLCTGPYIVSTAYVQYKAIFDNLKVKDPDNDVICPNAEFFLPTWDKLRTGWLRMICLIKKRYEKLQAREKKICDKLKASNFRNVPEDYSYTNHHWFHSWTEERSRYLSKSYSKMHIFIAVPLVRYGSDFARDEA